MKNLQVFKYILNREDTLVQNVAYIMIYDIYPSVHHLRKDFFIKYSKGLPHAVAGLIYQDCEMFLFHREILDNSLFSVRNKFVLRQSVCTCVKITKGFYFAE